MAKASLEHLRSQESRQKFVRDKSITDDFIDDDLRNSNPVRFLKDPDEIIPHDKVPEQLRAAVVSDCGEEVFLNTTWTRAMVKKLFRVMTHPRENMTNSIAMICSPSCPYKDECPYDIIGVAPFSSRCPKELAEAKEYYKQYVTAVANRQKQDPDVIQADMIYHNLITNLVEVDIVENRLRTIIAKEGNSDEYVNIINQETGEVYKKREEIVESKILERYDKKRKELFQQLLLTPEMEVKYTGRGNKEDKFTKHLEMLTEMETRLSKMLGYDKAEITDVESK